MEDRLIINLPILAKGGNYCLCCGKKLKSTDARYRIYINEQPQDVSYLFEHCPKCDIVWGKVLDIRTIRDHFEKLGIDRKNIRLPRFNVVSVEKSTKHIIQIFTYTEGSVPSEFFDPLEIGLRDKYSLKDKKKTTLQNNSETEYQKISCDLKSACYQLGIRLSPSSPLTIYTIVMRKTEVCPDKNIIHYSTREALTLLTAAYLKKRQCTFNGQLIHIERFIELEKASGICILGEYDGVTVQTKKNGGYYTTDPNVDQVMGLVYGPKTKMLQCIALSYDRIDEIYYVSRTVLKDFSEKYGYPIVSYRKPCGWGYKERAEESIVHILGYNVQRDKTSIFERRAILTGVIEAGICTTQEIVNLLESLIHINGRRHPDAQKEWESDLDFITQYKVDPEIIVAVNEFRNGSRRIR